MAIRFTYSITVAFDDDQIEQIRREAAKRKAEVEDLLDLDLDLNDLEDCARILLGDPIGTIGGDVEVIEASWGVDKVETGVPFEIDVRRFRSAAG